MPVAQVPHARVPVLAHFLDVGGAPVRKRAPPSLFRRKPGFRKIPPGVDPLARSRSSCTRSPNVMSGSLGFRPFNILRVSLGPGAENSLRSHRAPAEAGRALSNPGTLCENLRENPRKPHYSRFADYMIHQAYRPVLFLVVKPARKDRHVKRKDRHVKGMYVFSAGPGVSRFLNRGEARGSAFRSPAFHLRFGLAIVPRILLPDSTSHRTRSPSPSVVATSPSGCLLAETAQQPEYWERRAPSECVFLRSHVTGNAAYLR